MSYLDKLLEGVEVEWKPLGKVATIDRGCRVTKRELSSEKQYPVYSGGVTPMGYFDSYNNEANTITIVKYGTAGFVNFITEKFWANDVCYCIKPSSILDNKYLLYVLKNNQKHINSLATDAIPAHLPTEAINNLQIPIPCPENPQKSLEIQKEIVCILDTFTELTTKLTTELTTELTARKKQYNYYREQLLSFKEDEVEWKTLGDNDFFETSSGGTPLTSKKEYWDGGNIPWLKSESCNNEVVYSVNNYITELGLKKSSAKLLKRNTTLIALVGATIFKTAYLEFQATTNQNIASIKSIKPEVVNDKYIFYYLTNLYETLKSEMRNYGMLNLTTLRQFQIPIPPIEEQERIVAILDKFDILTTSISEGLPKEIKLRKKQYEYYRDLLLSFPKDNLKE